MWTPKKIALLLTRPGALAPTSQEAAWIQHQGGLDAVYALMRSAPLLAPERALLDALLTDPDACVADLSTRLSIDRSTYHRHKQRLVHTLALFLASAGSAPAGNLPKLPRPLTHLVGRVEERHIIKDLLSHPMIRLVTLTGIGGTGKTRLAIQAGYDTGAAFPDGVVFVSLADVTNPQLVLPAIAQRLEVVVKPGDVVYSLANLIGERRILLVLDNVEHVIAAAEEVAQLLAATVHLTILATSRRRLRVHGEHVVVIAPLPLPAALEIADASRPAPAVELFVQRAKAADPFFQLTPALLPTIVQICQQLDGLPLAIELAAARIPLLGPAQLLLQLQRRLTVLVGGARDGPRRQQTMRATLAWGYALLRDDERALLVILGLFGGSIGLDSIVALGAQSEALGSRTLEVLDALVDQSWVQRVLGNGSDVRFMLLHVVREFLQAMGHADPGRLVWQQRYATYFTLLTRRADDGYRTPDGTAWFDRLELEVANIRRALTWYLAHQEYFVDFGTTLVALAKFAWVRSCMLDIVDWYDQALAGLPAPLRGTLLHAELLHCRGYVEGDYDLIARYQEASLAIHRTLGPSPRMFQPLNWLAVVEQDRSHFDRAEALFVEALTLAEHCQDDFALVRVLHNYGLLLRDVRRDGVAAARLFERAYVISARLRHPEFTLMLELALGSICLANGRDMEAVLHAERAVAVCREARLANRLPTALNALMIVYYRQGNYAACSVAAVESVQAQQVVQDTERLGAALIFLAATQIQDRRYVEAARLIGASDGWMRARGLAVEADRGVAEVREQAIAAVCAHLEPEQWLRAYHEWQHLDAVAIRLAVLAWAGGMAAAATEGQAWQPAA